MTHIAILAGNPRINATRAELEIDPQIDAFNLALAFACSRRDRIAYICVAIDHPGIFQKHKIFLDPGISLSCRERRHLKLSHLHPYVRSQYEHIAYYWGFALSDIAVITEDTLRADIYQLVSRTDKRIFGLHEDSDSLQDTCSTSILGSKGELPKRNPLRVSCQGITAAIIRRLNTKQVTEVRTFWQFNLLRTDPSVIENGTRLAIEVFGITSALVQTMILRNPDNSLRIAETVFQ